MDADGDFVVAWESYKQDGDAYGVYARRYNAAGMPQGAEFQVNTFNTGSQTFPVITLDADGDFVVAWTSAGSQDGSSTGVYAQRYNAVGVPQGAEFRVNTTISSGQHSPSIALDADGDFVVAWVSDSQDGSYGGIYAQRYNATGVPQGAEFRVNSFTAGRQISPAVTRDADGDFAVAWESRDQDGSSYGVYAQRYSTAGVAQGGEFRVNTFTTGSQVLSTIGLDTDGDLVVTWQSQDQDGSSNGIYAQRYNNVGVAQGAATTP